MDNIILTRFIALSLFVITYFTCSFEILSFNPLNFIFPNTLPITCCQLFSIFMLFLLRKNKRKSIYPLMFLIVLIIIKDLIYQIQDFKILFIYAIVLIITIILLLIYSKIDKDKYSQ